MVLYVVFFLSNFCSMNDNFILLVPIEHIADKYCKLKKVTSEIEKTASNTRFLN